MTSQQQIKANQQNAKNSSGPITPEGKAIVSTNALKHGIFAKDLVITTGDGKENEEDYKTLLAELMIDFVPRGKMESLLVEKIAVNYWRLRRLIRYESGEIRNLLDNFRQEALKRYYDDSFSFSNVKKQPGMEFYNYGDEISDSEYQMQLERVRNLRSADYNFLVDNEALMYVLCNRLEMNEGKTSNSDYEKAKMYIRGLSPQLKGKLRREIVAEAEQILEEMEEVRTWEVKFDRLFRLSSLPDTKGYGKNHKV